MAGRVVDRGRMGRWRIDRRPPMTGGGVAAGTYGGEGAGAGQGGAGRPWACRACMRARRHHTCLPSVSMCFHRTYVCVAVCSVLGAAVLQKVKLVFSGTVTGESTGSGCTVPAV
jgi:hypothetical protein